MNSTLKTLLLFALFGLGPVSDGDVFNHDGKLVIEKSGMMQADLLEKTVRIELAQRITAAVEKLGHL